MFSKNEVLKDDQRNVRGGQVYRHTTKRKIILREDVIPSLFRLVYFCQAVQFYNNPSSFWHQYFLFINVCS